MKHNFEKSGFTLNDSREFEGKKCRVKVMPSVLNKDGGTFEGVLRPLTRTTTFVGENIIHNNEVLEIEDGLESSPV